MKPCRRCGHTDPRRMVALMTLWFGRFADLHLDGGYFYLCPRCYDDCIAPHFRPVVDRLIQRQRHPEDHGHDHPHEHGQDSGHGSTPVRDEAPGQL